MGLLDDVLGSAVPGGSLAKPIAVAAAALLAARATGAFGSGAAASPASPGAPASGQPQGGLLGGLSGLLQSFQQSGHGGIMNSWIGSGQNQPITPDQLHQALGPQAVDERLATREAVEIGGHHTPAAVGGRAAVRLGRGGILPPYVERGAAELSILERGVERILIDDRRPRY